MRSIRQRSSDARLLVLTSLAGGPKHGYAITRDVQHMSGRRLGPGTLYGVLARLEERGLIEPLPGDERRRPYRLTASGAEALHAELSTLARVARAGLKRLSASAAGAR